MKRIFIFFGLLAFAIGGQAQMNQHSNMIGVNVGGGLNTLMYSPADGTWNPKFGFLGELKYMHFFNNHFGLGIGAQIDFSRAGATFDSREVTPGLTHPVNGLSYESRTVYNGWKESQTITTLSIPLEFYWRTVMGERWLFLFGFGAQLDLPLKGSFTADDGSYELRGYFPSTGVEYRDLPGYGFSVYNADESGDIKDLKSLGVSLIADLGFNYALSNQWGFYFGIYGGYGITNSLDKLSAEPMLVAPDGTTNVSDYNGVINSVQTEEVHLFNVGAKVGINFGWNCHASEGEDNSPALVTYEDNNQDKEVNKNDEKPAEQAAEAAEKDEATRAAEEAAAREAQCKSNAVLSQAMSNIDGDLEEGEKFAEAARDSRGMVAVGNAKAKAEAAKAAYQSGQYCKANDLFKEAYGELANAYAIDAKAYASRKNVDKANKAADNAAVNAEAATRGNLESAIAATRNARANAIIARDAQEPEAEKPVDNKPATNRAAVQNAINQLGTAVLFDFNGTTPEIAPVADAALTTLCNAMAADNSIRILITGHTDNVGSPERNKALGLRRAEALKAVLVKRGAPAANIDTESKGESEPVVDNDTDEHRHQNRRAVVTLK